ncbi:MAG: hypothetical protein AAGC55_05660 [Myxococcota bacterium]
MRLRLIIALLVCAASAEHALAQQILVEGPGYEVDEGTVVHPHVGVSSGFVSNIFYEDGDGAATDPNTAPALRLMASLALASQHNKPETEVSPIIPQDEDNSASTSAPSLDFRLSGRVDYTQYLSGDTDVSEQNGFSNLAIGIDGFLVANPYGPVSVLLDNSFTRDTRPRNFESVGNLNRLINQFRGGVRLRPGNGALQFTGLYENWLDIFESDATDFANRLNHLLRARAEWQFLPITRFYLDTSFGFYGGLGNDNPAFDKVSSTPLRILLGGATAITELTTVRAHVGFGKSFYAEGAEFTGPLLGAEFGLRYSPTGRLLLAYQYTFQDSLNSNFYRDHVVSAKVDHQIQQVLVSAATHLRMRGYRGIPMALGPDSRDDLILGIEGEAHYLFREWLAFFAELKILNDSTDYIDANGDDPSYSRFELYAGATAAF